ncbi:tyrosine-specific transport protein [Legionella geestiana]|uniref:Tyrosine-specific transport protein n=1 Tax=Legionella geestiana TaxID=45065 RepID=A0A0W0TLK7_9GAMM|nr:aromatic amino acid transport family protein [Legionella geestiana]KTC96495.1 tyrosine-specific transport protein [Legionella geestiana]QBS12536.1 tryptophan/tyrosine permease [Legionella geestiana]QDQ39748.1 tryptophan/tyrosine permease [Legionella geestiana]STX55017.1 tyrosine-specific transport protein [Legionella geestiana]
MARSRFIGGTLLIAGTSIGGGMLALPVATAGAGFTGSLIFLVLCWLIMTTGALLLLEASLRLPPGSNLVSIAKSTLGLPGQVLAWSACLLLLYTLLAAYISGGSDVFAGILGAFRLRPPEWLAAIVFTGVLSLVVYRGIRSVDFVNRGLMFGKLGVYLLLVLVIAPWIKPSALRGGDLHTISASLMILITSFGFASIVPSLRDYFQDDIPALRKVIIIGSLIPLACYILWNAVIMGVIDREGTGGLLELGNSGHAASGLTVALTGALHNPLISAFFSFFSSICMITAFLAVSLGLYDFLADGLSLKKSGKEGKSVLLLTFAPPLLVVLFNPGIYLNALNYAGICCVLLLLVLPVLMTWRGRRVTTAGVIVPGGNLTLALVAISAMVLLYIAIL